ncbi:hypothetical protein M0813_10196 [Anaeramoeba flamelloides]|uniref:Uncharacterized protein n=1 Tax=Anaeramoeba flamelloides TaxID=1746091 RepID=A0ABQ8X4G4_9EUKA|nr:hypothetical protein M0813_10196 [Anaeramoeba flamelloides]
MHNNKYCNIVKQKQITNKKGKQKEKEKEMKKEKEQEKVKEKEKETINKKTNDLQEGVNLIDHVLDPDTIRKETETGVKFQQDNIWIHELELDPTSTSHFPICWFHLLLEGLIKNIFKIMCSSMRVTFLNLANQRYKKIKLPKGFKRINNPFGTNHLTSIDVQILIQFCSLCVADLVEKKFINFFYLSSLLISNLYQPTRNKEIDDNLHKIISLFISLYKKCSNQNCDRISNLHIFAHHLEESIKNNGGMNTLFFALEKYHQWFKSKYGQLHKNQTKTIYYYSNKEISKKYIQYFKLFKNKLNGKNNRKILITDWKLFDKVDIQFNINKYPFESKSIIYNKHKFLLQQNIQLRNFQYAKIIKFLFLDSNQNSNPYIAVRYYLQKE